MAPYGQAAIEILSDKGQWPAPEGWVTQYHNIALTKTAVEEQVQVAGFISKAQVCASSEGGVLRDFDSKYNLQQKGVLLTAADTTVEAFRDYLTSETIQQRLVIEFCYASPSSSNNQARSAQKR